MLVGKDKNRWMKQCQGTARLEMQVEDGGEGKWWEFAYFENRNSKGLLTDQFGNKGRREVKVDPSEGASGVECGCLPSAVWERF